MANVVIYTGAHCGYCTMAKQLLTSKQVAFEEVRIDLDADKREEMLEKSGRRTIPQIFINDEAIGGFDDLKALDAAGKLDLLLAN